MRLDGTMLHGLNVVDAAMVGLAYMEKVYPDRNKRTAEYRRLAKVIGIPMAEDPALAAQRNRAAQAQIAADFLSDGD